MRVPIKGAIAFFMRDTGRRRKRPDWSLVLGWAGLAIALCILFWFLLIAR